MSTKIVETREKNTISAQKNDRPQLNILKIENLHAEIDGEEILKGINLTIRSGEIHAIMGPNGSGKSTLCKVLMGHPHYEVTKGSATFNNQEILEMEPNERANLGIFLGFQHPLEIPGVTLGNFLRIAKNANIKALDKEAKEIGPADFMQIMRKNVEKLGMDSKFAGRSVNEGFSGGEKKRAEIVQMAVLEPKLTLLDEIDSGLDIDALKVVAQGINDTFQKTNSGILMITHYQRILDYVTPDFIHIMTKGKIVKSGGKELALELEKEGYEKYLKA